MAHKQTRQRPAWAEAIILLRKRIGITQRELADLLGIAHCQIANYEVGRHRPRPERMSVIFVVLTTAS